MKVGDYIRTKPYGIRKILEIGKCMGETAYLVDEENRYWALEITIESSSPNILDLIEDHDILKIEEQKGVYTICEVELFKEPYTNYKFLGVRLGNQPMARRLCELNIKQILTKEQFESMKYEVR